jgi:hydroxymethylpyrimidine/phosphomethylpyrimidine kinase
MTIAAIGTTHPWNVAGVGLDLARGRSRGVRVVIALAGVSAQDAHGVHAVHAVPPAVVAAQLASFAELPIAAIRIGLLPSVAAVRAVAAALGAFPGIPVVCDPVRGASVGGSLVLEETRDALLADLVPRCTVVTPNLAEAAWLAGEPVASRDEMRHAGERLLACGAAAVLVKGGHLAGVPVDLRVDARGARAFAGERLPTTLRGTGDLLAFALACALGARVPLDEAIAQARDEVRAAIADGVAFGGMRVAD